MKETWSPIKDFENYEISNTGKVRSVISGKEKSFKDSKGYPAVDLYSNGKRKTKRIHRLVAETYLPKIEGLNEINHIDGDKYNPDVTNLEWCNRSSNMLHAFKTGLSKPSMGMLGKKNPNAGRKGIKVRIIETGEEFESITECEKAINGNNRHICDCLSGKQKTHRGYHFEYI